MNFCLNCKRELTGSKKNNKYCNATCQQEYEHKIYIERWKTGKETGASGTYQISRHIRQYLFDKYNSSCCECGWNKENLFTHLVPLEIHHKDGDHSNNSEDNLVLLCPNCHALTENFRSRGNGRENRKKYYLTNTCIDCGTPITNTSTRCNSCAQKHRHQKSINGIPISREELKCRIRTETFTDIGKDFEVSYATIKKWALKYNLPNTKIGIKQYTDEEWESL